jgi:hypothetical protein
MISSRTKAALAAAKARGTRLGNRHHRSVVELPREHKPASQYARLGLLNGPLISSQWCVKYRPAVLNPSGRLQAYSTLAEYQLQGVASGRQSR